MQLNKGQQEAEEAVFNFLMSEDKEFILSGSAGVGKTFLMRHIMDNLLKRYNAACDLLQLPNKLDTMELTATTNKAAEVLQYATGYPSSTIHSFLGLKVFDDYKTGVSKVKKTANWTVHNNIVLFIDEASMIDSPLHKFILEGTNKNCKIIYVGDHNQLAPIFETISPVYKDPKHFVVLTEPMRNADQPALMDLCSQLRETVETLKFKPIEAVPGVIDYINDADLKTILDTEFIKDDFNCRILCYTNQRVILYNDYIRGIRGYGNTYEVGEKVINNIAMEMGKTMLRVEQEFEVLEVIKPIHEVQIDSIDKNSGMMVYTLKIKDVKSVAQYVVNVPADADHYKSMMKYYAKIKAWQLFYHLKNNFPDLRPKDSSTVYKAQGSTYDSVIIDLTNISTCHQPDQVARMLYVAASRPKNRVFLYGKLSEKYGGI